MKALKAFALLYGGWIAGLLTAAAAAAHHGH